MIRAPRHVSSPGVWPRVPGGELAVRHGAGGRPLPHLPYTRRGRLDHPVSGTRVTRVMLGTRVSRGCFKTALMLVFSEKREDVEISEKMRSSKIRRKGLPT